MPIIKKFIFAPPFVLLLAAFYQNLNTYLGNIYFIFSLDFQVLLQIITFLLLTLLAGLFFSVFITLSQHLKLTLPVAFLGSLSSLIFIPPPFNLVILLGSLLSLILTSFTLSKKLSSYLNFQPTNLLTPSINQLSVLLILVASITFYLAADAQIKKAGFQIPDSVIDPVIAMSMNNLTEGSAEIPAQRAQPQIPPEQIEMLRQNPTLLQQYGLDPSILDELSPQTSKTPQNPQQALIKNEVKKQINTLIQPQIQFLPIILAALFFLTLKFGLSILSFILYPAIWLIFWILEKTGFTTYTKEMREVKKLVV